jgi:hypothetical protein
MATRRFAIVLAFLAMPLAGLAKAQNPVEIP